MSQPRSNSPMGRRVRVQLLLAAGCGLLAGCNPNPGMLPTDNIPRPACTILFLATPEDLPHLSHVSPDVLICQTLSPHEVDSMAIDIAQRFPSLIHQISTRSQEPPGTQTLWSRFAFNSQQVFNLSYRIKTKKVELRHGLFENKFV